MNICMATSKELFTKDSTYRYHIITIIVLWQIDENTLCEKKEERPKNVNGPLGLGFSGPRRTVSRAPPSNAFECTHITRLLYTRESYPSNFGRRLMYILCTSALYACTIHCGLYLYKTIIQYRLFAVSPLPNKIICKFEIPYHAAAAACR